MPAVSHTSVADTATVAVILVIIISRLGFYFELILDSCLYTKLTRRFSMNGLPVSLHCQRPTLP